MRRLLLALFAVLMPGLSWAGVVWRGDFETGGITQYTRAQRVSADRLQIVQSPAFQGRYALKATVRQGDDPIDSSGNRNELVYMGQEKEGSEYYYRWQVMFPTDYPSVDAWQVFTQWHHSGCCGSPPVEFFVKGEEMRLTLADSATPWKTKLVRGVWQDFIFHVKWSSDASVGFVELWLNGQRVLSKYKYATLYEGDGVYLKLGLYRSDTVKPVGVVYHDGYTQATQLADVLPPPEPRPRRWTRERRLPWTRERQRRRTRALRGRWTRARPEPGPGRKCPRRVTHRWTPRRPCRAREACFRRWAIRPTPAGAQAPAGRSASWRCWGSSGCRGGGGAARRAFVLATHPRGAVVRGTPRRKPR